MKIKMFSLLAVVFFMGSSFDLSNVPDPSFNYDHCMGQALVTQYFAEEAGFSPSRAYSMGSNAYDSCVDAVDREAAAYYGVN